MSCDSGPWQSTLSLSLCISHSLNRWLRCLALCIPFSMPTVSGLPSVPCLPTSLTLKVSVSLYLFASRSQWSLLCLSPSRALGDGGSSTLWLPSQCLRPLNLSVSTLPLLPQPFSSLSLLSPSRALSTHHLLNTMKTRTDPAMVRSRSGPWQDWSCLQPCFPYYSVHGPGRSGPVLDGRIAPNLEHKSM